MLIHWKSSIHVGKCNLHAIKMLKKVSNLTSVGTMYMLMCMQLNERKKYVLPWHTVHGYCTSKTFCICHIMKLVFFFKNKPGHQL